MLSKKTFLFTFTLFLFFFPVYIVFYNMVFYTFDHLFTNGQVSEIFTYNYYGGLNGCLASAKYQELSKSFSAFQIYGTVVFAFLVSVLSFVILTKKKMLKFSYKWSFVFLFSFYLFESLTYISTALINMNSTFFKQTILFLVLSISTLLMALIIFVKVFDKKDKILTFICVLPSTVLSLIIWYQYIGPKLLPV